MKIKKINKGSSIILLILMTMLIAGLPGCAAKQGVPAAASAVSSKEAVSSQAASSSAVSSAVQSQVASSQAAASKPASSKASSPVVSADTGPIPAETVPQNANGKVICIDPGHQQLVDLTTEPIAPGSSVMKVKNPGGAQGVATKMPEYELNLIVAKKVRVLLLAQGYTIVMTRVDNSGNISNIGRAQVANACKADIFLRIHADSTTSSSVTGISVQIPGGQYIKDTAMLASSRSVGQHILDGMLAATGDKSRGLVVRNDMTGFNWSTRPVVLVEMGFLSNPGQDELMSTDAYQNKLAQGMANGIYSYFAAGG